MAWIWWALCHTRYGRGQRHASVVSLALQLSAVQGIVVTCSPRSAHNRVRFSYSGVRAEHVEEQAYGGADDRCAEAGGGGPEGGRRSPGVRSVQAHHLCLE